MPAEVELGWLLLILAQSSILVAVALGARAMEQEKFRNEIELSALAAQVSHDIRSPLAALKTVVRIEKNLSDANRQLLQSSIERILSIGNELLKEKRKLAKNQQTSGSQMSSKQMALAIDEIIFEKRSEYQNLENVRILSFAEQHSNINSASFDQNVFKRILSNLVNNSIESLLGPGQITIEMKHTKTHIVVSVIDTGKGMSIDTLKSIVDGKHVSEKPEGQGLGLSYAKKAVELSGGKLEIKSHLGSGTTVELHLRKI